MTGGPGMEEMGGREIEKGGKEREIKRERERETD